MMPWSWRVRMRSRQLRREVKEHSAVSIIKGYFKMRLDVVESRIPFYIHTEGWM